MLLFTAVMTSLSNLMLPEGCVNDAEIASRIVVPIDQWTICPPILFGTTIVEFTDAKLVTAVAATRMSVSMLLDRRIWLLSGDLGVHSFSPNIFEVGKADYEEQSYK